MTISISAARDLWEPEVVYLDSASYGLPARPVLEALDRAHDEWRSGTGVWEQWSVSAERSRESFARLTGVPVSQVAIGSTVSGLLGPVAASLPPGSRVVAPEIDFTSVLFPFMVHAERGVEVDAVPLRSLADAIGPETDLVAFSLAQSATGELADLDSVIDAAEAHGAITVVDATQACGWLPIDASRVDFVVCAAYKWLCSPRGTAFLTVRPERLKAIPALSAGWFAGEDPHTSYYRPPLRLAHDARRLDVSPAWHAWVGAQPALELFERIGIEAIHEHDVGLANRFREGLGLEPADSAIVSAEAEDARERLEQAGVRAATRDGGLRASFHLYNTEADVDRALEALAG